MRIGWVVVGVVVILIGAALLFVPLEPQANQTADSSSSTPYYVASVSGFSLTGSIPIAVSWTTNGSTPVDVVAAACSGTCQSISQVSGITSQNGTSGSFALNQPDGGSVLMGVVYSGHPGVTVTFKITTALTTIGTILVVVGILLLIVGLVLRKKSGAAPAAAPATPTSETTNPPRSN
jgi:uncharacterized membrane protein